MIGLVAMVSNERGLERWVRGASRYFMYSARRLRVAEEIGAFWARVRIRDGSELVGSP